MSEKRYQDGDWLREQYVANRRSTRDIADELGCDAKTISRYMKKHGISARNSGGSATPDDRLLDVDWLSEQYVEEGRTTLAIADELECDDSTVRKYLREHGIEVRQKGDSPTPERLKDSDWLRGEYVDRDRSSLDIADELGCCAKTVRNWLERHSIKTRGTGRAGADNHSWAGGETTYGSGWNRTKRRQVRARDDHVCQDCGMSQKTHREQFGEKLHVHHLLKARDVDDAEERNAMSNLITLCQGCHPKWERMSKMKIRPEIDWPGEGGV